MSETRVGLELSSGDPSVALAAEFRRIAVDPHLALAGGPPIRESDVSEESHVGQLLRQTLPSHIIGDYLLYFPGYSFLQYGVRAGDLRPFPGVEERHMIWNVVTPHSDALQKQVGEGVYPDEMRHITTLTPPYAMAADSIDAAIAADEFSRMSEDDLLRVLIELIDVVGPDTHRLLHIQTELPNTEFLRDMSSQRFDKIASVLKEKYPGLDLDRGDITDASFFGHYDQALNTLYASELKPGDAEPDGSDDEQEAHTLQSLLSNAMHSISSRSLRFTDNRKPVELDTIDKINEYLNVSAETQVEGLIESFWRLSKVMSAWIHSRRNFDADQENELLARLTQLSATFRQDVFEGYLVSMLREIPDVSEVVPQTPWAEPDLKTQGEPMRISYADGVILREKLEPGDEPTTYVTARVVTVRKRESSRIRHG